MSRRQTTPIDETRQLVGRHRIVVASRLEQEDLRIRHDFNRRSLSLPTRRWSALGDSHEAEMAVDRESVADADRGGNIWNTCNARQAVFAGDDGAVNQRAAAALGHRARHWHDKGHVGIDRIADQHLAALELEEVVDIFDHTRDGGGHAGTSPLADELPRARAKTRLDTRLLRHRFPLDDEIVVAQRTNEIFELHRQVTTMLLAKPSPAAANRPSRLAAMVLHAIRTGELHSR